MQIAYKETTMPLCGDQNETVVQHKGSCRKYGMQNDDEFNVERNEDQGKQTQHKGKRDKAVDDRNRDGSAQSRIPLSNSGVKKMERGISKAAENEFLVNEARNKLEQDFGSLGLGTDVSHIIKNGEDRDKFRAAKSPNFIEDMSNMPGTAWVKDGYEGDSGSSGNTSNSPNHVDGSASTYRSGGEKLASITVGFIETPVYTFILPDLTIYPGNNYSNRFTIDHTLIFELSRI